MNNHRPITQLKPVKCCYCGRTFTPKTPKRPGDTIEFHNLMVEMGQFILDAGAPLECGKCRGPDGMIR